MKKQSLHLLIASSILLAMPTNYAAMANQDKVDSYKLAYSMSALVDVPSNHWAYNAVKFLVEELGIMAPKSNNAFMGNSTLTRYELAEVFYRAMKRLEQQSGADLSDMSKKAPKGIPDADAAYRQMVDAVVNKYGIMQLIQGKFYGNLPISRYEIAFELANYFNLVEKNSDKKCSITPRARASQLRDLDPNHWTYNAVRSIIDKHQLMDGYEDNTFRGDKPLTRYEGSAVISKFVKYVDRCYKPRPKATPTPVVPTPKPTPTPVQRPGASVFDLTLGAPYQMSQGSNALSPYPPYVTGGQGEATLWLGPVGLTGHGEYLFAGKDIPFVGQTADLGYANRWRGGGGLNFRLWGSKYRDGGEWTLGLGADVAQFAGGAQLMGPTAKMGLSLPLGSWAAIVADARFSWYNGFTNWDFGGIMSNMRGDAFGGLAFPAWGWGQLQLGYNVVMYSTPGQNSGNQVMEHGPKVNLKFAF